MGSRKTLNKAPVILVLCLLPWQHRLTRRRRGSGALGASSRGPGGARSWAERVAVPDNSRARRGWPGLRCHHWRQSHHPAQTSWKIERGVVARGGRKLLWHDCVLAAAPRVDPSSSSRRPARSRRSTACLQSGCPDGSNPVAPLIQAANGDLYGTTSEGGDSVPGLDRRRVRHSIQDYAHRRAYYPLHFFARAGCADGLAPYGPLVQASDGNSLRHHPCRG